MRKIQKKQLLELTDTLQEAQDEMKKLLGNGNIRVATQLFADCQNCAMHLGNTIEQLEGKETKAVSFLEDYCESLYQLSTSVGDSDIVKKTFYTLKDQLSHARSNIADFKIDKIEVVFLPYKASMWDSLESVWLAAKDDPQCDAYVIPIPYFDRLPNGAMGQSHYEGNCLPEHVPITDWQKYSLKDRHPDITFIHNPYDDGNFVTSIHPDYYSKIIKNYTDMLVYIPYFVSMRSISNNFCLNPGTIFSDKVIVQSEKIRDTYIMVFRNFEKENNCVGAFGKATKKFIALGSPKFDKVINTKKEDCVIPEEWAKLIERPDGTQRKVILYNTSISELLQGNEVILTKLKYVFSAFKKREDVVLLWRPHPLSASTYSSMRPQLLNEYRQMADEYRRAAFGIYDDTADMNRSLAISDAYYGDHGSLVALYQCTGKPLMIQNFEFTNEDDAKDYLGFEAMYDAGEYIYIVSYSFNGLFRIKKDNWEAEYMGSFPNENRFGFRLYSSITAYDGKLYFTPFSAQEFAEYDTIKHAFNKIEIKEPRIAAKVQYTPEWKFYASVQYKQWIFFIPGTYHAFARYDTVSGKVDYFSDWVEPLDKLITEPDAGHFSHEVCVIDSSFFIAARNANAVVEFSMETCASKVHEVGPKGYTYCGCCFDGTDFWLPPRKEGPIVKWNYETNEFKELIDFPDGFSIIRHGFSFWCTTYAGGYVWIFPSGANMALKIDPKNEHISFAEEFQPKFSDENRNPSLNDFTLSKLSDNILYAYCDKSGELISYNIQTKELKKERIPIPDGVFDQVLNDTAATDGIILEDSISIQKFFDIVQSGIKAPVMPDIQNPDGTAGLHIYSYCKQIAELK